MSTSHALDAATVDYLQAARVGHLATVGADARPTVVPICFVLMEHGGEPVIVSALDEKPKRVAPERLARVRNIQAHPDVMLLVDDYAEDWTRLRFVQVHGRARLLGPDDAGHAAAITLLRAKYPQYESMALSERAVIEIGSLSARSWRGGPNDSAERLDRPGAADLARLVRGRRSVRSFQPRPVPAAIIEQAIAAAGWAPSPHGRQPWRFAVVEAPARRAALATAMAVSWEEQLRLDGQAPTVMARRLERSQQRLRDAPILVVPCLYLADLEQYPDAARQEAERIMAIQSIGAAIQNLLLTIYAAGLDAGWMCAPLFCPDLVREQLGLAAALTPHALIPVGYAANDPVRRERLPLDALIVNWE